MDTLYELKKEKNKYLNLKSKIETAIKNLKNVRSNLKDVSNDIYSYYSINGENADNKNFNSIRNNLKEKINYLEYNVINNIEKKIDSLNSQIRNYNENVN